jgi:hypothetical protein
MVDIDGVISLFGFPHNPGQPWGSQRSGDATEGSIRAEGSSGAVDRGGAMTLTGTFHSIDGMPHFLSATAAAHLLGLADHFDLVWASGWEERADEHLPRLLGLPRGLPFLRFERSPGRTHAHWKLEAIDAYAGTRPVAWIDDSFNEACHEWAARRAAPTLLVSTNPEWGLTGREAEVLAEWARERASTG